MAFIFSKLSATDPVATNMASSELTGVEELAAAADMAEDRAFEESLERRPSSSFLRDELSKSDILSLDSLK